MTTYHLTSKKIDGHIEVQYENGILKAVQFDVKAPLNDKQFKTLAAHATNHEADLAGLKFLGLIAVKQQPPNERIALWHSVYERIKGIKYTMQPREKGQMKLIKFDQPMLEFYLTSDNFLWKDKQSVGNFVRYFNEVKAAYSAGTKSKYPNHFDREFLGKLPVADHKFYYSHLRSLGLKAQYDRTGNVTDWIKAN